MNYYNVHVLTNQGIPSIYTIQALNIYEANKIANQKLMQGQSINKVELNKIRKG